MGATFQAKRKGKSRQKNTIAPILCFLTAAAVWVSASNLAAIELLSLPKHGGLWPQNCEPNWILSVWGCLSGQVASRDGHEYVWVNLYLSFRNRSLFIKVTSPVYNPTNTAPRQWLSYIVPRSLFHLLWASHVQSNLRIWCWSNSKQLFSHGSYGAREGTHNI